MLHQIKAPQFYTDVGLQTLMNPPLNGKIQGLFKVFFSVFQALFKAILIFKDFSRRVLSILVLFKPVQTLKKKVYNLLVMSEIQTCNIGLRC